MVCSDPISKGSKETSFLIHLLFLYLPFLAPSSSNFLLWLLISTANLTNPTLCLRLCFSLEVALTLSCFRRQQSLNTERNSRDFNYDFIPLAIYTLFLWFILILFANIVIALKYPFPCLEHALLRFFFPP